VGFLATEIINTGMNFKIFYYIQEALKPSQYRQYMKDKSYRDRHDEFFQGKHRKYFPFRGDTSYQSSMVQREVTKFLKDNNFDVLDYVKGMAQEAGPEQEKEITDKQGNKRTVKIKKRMMKIGKLLASNPELQQKFQDDPQRAGSKQVNQMIVFSRHPYDIAGMSTDRGWSSCMNLQGGCNKHYVAHDVEEGSIVAYLIKANDKNINNPIARILFKPHDHVDDSEEQILIPDTVYGSPPPGFKETAKKIIDSGLNVHAQDGTYSLNPNLYQDHDTGIATKWGDEVTHGMDVHDLDKIPDNILRSSQFVDMIDNSEEGYEIYYQGWDSYPEALKDNEYFADRYKEHHRDYMWEEKADSWDEWNNVEQPFKDESDFAEEWVKHNEHLLGETEFEEIPDELIDEVGEDKMAEWWIESNSNYLDMEWEEFKAHVIDPTDDEDLHDVWIEKWASWDGNLDTYYDMEWDQIPDELKQEFNSDYWTDHKKVTRMDQVPWDEINQYSRRDIISHIFRVNPEEKEKALSDKETFTRLPANIQGDFLPEYLVKDMKDEKDVKNAFQRLYPDMNPSDGGLERVVRRYFELNPEALQKYYNMSEEDARKEPSYITRNLDPIQFYAGKDWDDSTKLRSSRSHNNDWIKEFQDKWLEKHPEARDKKPIGWKYFDDWKPEVGDNVEAFFRDRILPFEVTEITGKAGEGTYNFTGKYTGPDTSIGRGESLHNGDAIRLNTAWVPR
jgi:hypothetical protein